MKISKITPTGRRPVYDLSINSEEYDEQQYILKNGVISHNTGSYYSADNIFILGRQQEKEGKEVVGYNFIINVEKSRYVKEKSKIPLSVSFDGGISKWSGLLELALESGHVIKPSNGWYSRVDLSTGEPEEKKYRLKDIDNKDFWLPIATSKSFNDFVSNKYQIATGSIIRDEDIAEEVEKMVEDNG